MSWFYIKAKLNIINYENTNPHNLRACFGVNFSSLSVSNSLKT